LFEVFYIALALLCLVMQNNKNGGRVRLKDIQNMLAKDFNIHYQNINNGPQNTTQKTKTFSI
jgi:hypothetical protein